MKINIFFNFQDGPWGGGNQFLKNLRSNFQEKKISETDIKKAEIIILNSYHNFLEGLKIKLKYPPKKLVFRLGPVFSLHRGKEWRKIDKLIIRAVNIFADQVIFQSLWAKEQAIKLGFKSEKPHQIIHNAPDNKFFFPESQRQKKDTKISLLINSWSKNPKKGFKYYQYLDENMDFKKFEIIFAGNSPVKFRNIQMLKAQNSQNLAKILKSGDIFISGVEDDACSNSILEALACGLPVIALNSGANGEIIGNDNLLFKTPSEMLEKINLISRKLSAYRNQAKIEDINTIANKYINFLDSDKNYLPKREKFQKIYYYQVLFYWHLFRLYNKATNMIFGKNE